MVPLAKAARDVPDAAPFGKAFVQARGPPVPCPGRDIAFLKTAGHSSHRCSSPPPPKSAPKPTSSSGLPRWMPTAACGALRSPLRRRMPAQFPALGEHRTRAGRALGVDGAELPRLGASGGRGEHDFFYGSASKGQITRVYWVTGGGAPGSGFFGNL